MVVLDVVPQSVLDLAALLLGQLHLCEELQGLHAWPHLWGDGPTEDADELQLVLLCASLQDRTACPHFSHHTPCPPQVDGRAVVAVTQQNLWRTVPECHHTVGEALALGRTEHASKAKVSKLQDTVFSDEDVGGLHVPVEDLILVNEVETIEELA